MAIRDILQTSDAFACAMVHEETMRIITSRLLGATMLQYGRYKSGTGIFGQLEALCAFMEEQVTLFSR